MSKYITARLKATDEATMLTALSQVFGTDDDGNLLTASHNHFVDLIGTLYAETGNTLTDDDGNEYAEKEALEGYHVNVRSKNQSDIDALADYVVETKNPMVKFAGEE